MHSPAQFLEHCAQAFDAEHPRVDNARAKHKTRNRRMISSLIAQAYYCSSMIAAKILDNHAAGRGAAKTWGDDKPTGCTSATACNRADATNKWAYK